MPALHRSTRINDQLLSAAHRRKRIRHTGHFSELGRHWLKCCDVAQPILEPSDASRKKDCNWWSTGKKFFPTNINSGTIAGETRTRRVIITHRSPIENRKRNAYPSTTNRNQLVCLRGRISLSQMYKGTQWKVSLCSDVDSIFRGSATDSRQCLDAHTARSRVLGLSTYVFLISLSASIGVKENETMSETSTANETVSPKLDINRPTMPCIKPNRAQTPPSG